VHPSGFSNLRESMASFLFTNVIKNDKVTLIGYALAGWTFSGSNLSSMVVFRGIRVRSHSHLHVTNIEFYLFFAFFLLKN